MKEGVVEATFTSAKVMIDKFKLSPSTATKDQSIKYELYEQEGVDYCIIVNSKEGIAKAYELKEGRYIKIADVSDETISFTLDTCSFDFYFSKIWD
ncbi:MAG: Uma2 family endonuclease [Campylobacterota bacterium]|nr:Uma2 family endonuclease [Campylobacterota bacterium]